MGVKHVVFLELWLGITSLELWLGMTDEHEELLSCGSGWWVCWLWPARMGPNRLPSSVISWRVWYFWDVTNYVRIGNATWHYGVWSVAWFSAHALSVVVDRYGSKTCWGTH